MTTFWKVAIGILATIGAITLVNAGANWRLRHDIPDRCEKYIGWDVDSIPDDYRVDWWENYQTSP